MLSSIMHPKRWLLMIAGVSSIGIMSQIALASPPGSKYTPGETLDPGCSVGDSNCTVTVPLQSSNNLSDVGSTSTARSNLGLVINTDVQGYSAALASIGNLTTAANKMIYTTGSNTYATTDLTAAARLLLAASSTGAMITILRASTGGVANDTVTSAKIVDGAIMNGDINASAAIAFSKLNIAKSDITGLGIPGSDTNTTYSAGSGLSLNGTTFSIQPYVVTGSYSRSIRMRGNLTVTGGTFVSANSRFAGNLMVEGSMTANMFEGDASLLTNVQPSNGSVGSSTIVDGAISNVHINSSAAIAFSKLNIAASDIRGLSAYTAGTGLQLSGGQFSITSSVVTSNYGGSVILAGSISPSSIITSTSDSAVPNTMTNTSAGAGAGVLTLSLSNILTPSTTNKYVDFLANGSSIGAIRGNGAGGAQMSWAPGLGEAFNNMPGLQFVSVGADYAEYLERADHTEKLQPGDIVGVKEGKISRATLDADRAMVVSAQPVVIGNQPAKNVEDFNTVAFVGQVYVRVIGPVVSGQYIVASGKNDGIGVTKDKNDIQPDDLIVGQAWENNATIGETYVKIGIIPESGASNGEVNALRRQVEELRSDIRELRALIHAQ